MEVVAEPELGLPPVEVIEPGSAAAGGAALPATLNATEFGSADHADAGPPTLAGQALASRGWSHILAICGIAGGAGLITTCLVLEFGGFTQTKIGPFSRWLLLVLGLSGWLGSYLLFRLGREMARFATHPHRPAQLAVLALATRRFWQGVMLAVILVCALGVTLSYNW